MANLDVGVDAKLRLKFVTHNKSVSGYFTSHGTETIRQDGWLLTASSIYNTGINKCMYSVLAVYCSVAGWHVYWSQGSRNCSNLRPAQSQTRPEVLTNDDHDMIWLSTFKILERKSWPLYVLVSSCIISPGSDRGFNWQTSDKEAAINFPHSAFPLNIDTEGCFNWDPILLISLWV